jgi:multidrug efflux pump subunit AcrB
MKPELRLGLAGRVAQAFVNSKLTPLFLIASVLLGAFSIWRLPREEEPQIVVPMSDIFVRLPGASPKEVESRVTQPLERVLHEIPGVEYLYSTSSPGLATFIVRFKVGEDQERSTVRLQEKLGAHLDLLPPGASRPLVVPRSIDDVPILAVTLFSARYSGYELRRLAAEIREQVKQVPGVSEVTLTGGERRQIRVQLDPDKLAARQLSPLAVARALEASNERLLVGAVAAENRELLLETGNLLTSADDVGGVAVGVSADRPVLLRDVASILDGPEEPSTYVRFGAGAAAEGAERALGAAAAPAVTLSVAKHKGQNAVGVVADVWRKIDALRGTLIPKDVSLTTARDYGRTADEKSNELLFHMGISVASVAALIGLALGRREAGIVLLAIPATLALTLAVFYLYGYTLNRITLFALIFSIGILVDDAIVVLENITRHARLPENHGRSLAQVAVRAVDEVGNPTILATMTVIAAILPMVFVGGLMGPYMRPIPVGSTAAMVFSLIVAFVAIPWATVRLLRRSALDHAHEGEGRATQLYRRVMGALLRGAGLRRAFLAGVALLLLVAVSLVALKVTRVKMLPFDNKSEFQVVIDMPEGTTLEQTDRVTRAMAEVIRSVPEVKSYESYVGVAGPYNFSGLVRHYFLRQGSNVADIQVNLVDKTQRQDQSHAIAKRVRDAIAPIAAEYAARVKVAEVPPGPPVLQSLVAEIYGPSDDGRLALAKQVRDLMDKTPGVVDVDWLVEDPQPKLRFAIDQEKAALSGVSSTDIVRALSLATNGESRGQLHDAREKEGVPIVLRLERASRSDLERVRSLRIAGRDGNLVSLGELVRPELVGQQPSIYHKNLLPVVYVTADVAGAIESPVYAMLALGPALDRIKLADGHGLEQHAAAQPFLDDHYSMKWDGEWQVTYDVFRDLGAAFAVVLLLIYVLNVAWFQSFKTPLVIMSVIPFALIGILPAHALLGTYFSAPSLVGFIAGAGIVVRNSIILVDFIEQRLADGSPLEQAVVDAGAIRFRPMLLTAAAVVMGASVILFDPIFGGLAISLMAGEIASLLLSRMTVPVLYFMLRKREALAALRPSPASVASFEPPAPASGSFSHAE